MAACGLSASNPDALRSQESKEYLPSGFRLSDDDRSPSFRSSDFKMNDKFSFENDVVYAMMCFALDLLRAMRAFNMESRVQNEEKSRRIGALRIGISNGPVMAGVVGLYKPFYDVWGNAVNMASRMDSTGTPDSIQVTEESARILESYQVHCIYRGETYVKGRGNIPTYFVNIDEDLRLIRDTEDTNLSRIEE
ncbi:adenylyl cyclase X E-like [Rhagoletis pomonella]|uniref:adenylyl cyclase X E-like n=1 Tax=Rhagoletis pomonella TaxID=28610 RepID=UPI00178081E5|nr:adenylyl cyclase X E-like [Rhagoletis pomonella]